MTISAPLHARTITTVLLIALSGLLLASTAAQAIDEADKEAWQQEYRSLIILVRDAEKRVEAAKADRTRARTRDRFQGSYRKKIEADLTQAENDLTDGMKRLDEFPEKARVAGVPPGWLREVEMEMGL